MFLNRPIEPNHNPPTHTHSHTYTALHYDASEQGDCLLARLSLDSALLAIQRSRHVVEVGSETKTAASGRWDLRIN